jgi:hypothetical protein
MVLPPLLAPQTAWRVIRRSITEALPGEITITAALTQRVL